MIMTALSWPVLGVMIGFFHHEILDRDSPGLMVDLVFGVAGAVVAGALFLPVGKVLILGFNVSSVLGAAAGALVVLGVYHGIVGSSSGRR